MLVAVSDTGRGMSPEVLARIWEPFYTTRPVGVGGGLGLPVSLAIIDQHRGFMEARSAAGRGSTFSVWLPVKGWPDCWKVTDGCTDEIRFACPVFRDQICHRCWSNRGAVCREKGWPNPFLVKPPALIEEV